jgi:hypothetical protein
MKKTTFKITVKIPTEEEAGKLTKVPNGKKPVSKLEKKRFFKDIFMLIALGTFTFLIGGYLLGKTSFGTLFLLVVKWVVPFVCLFLLFDKIPSSAQKKTIEGAMNWIFIKSLFAFEKSVGTGYKISVPTILPPENTPVLCPMR